MIFWNRGSDNQLWLNVTFAPAFLEAYSVLYPVAPWLAMMMLGWAYGACLLSGNRNPSSASRLLFICGVVALLLFAVIRGFDAYGNMFMQLAGNTIVQWLHVSKYPPSLSYILLELGLMAIILAVLIVVERYVGVRRNGFVLVFGQTALFFYLAHFAVLALLGLFIERGGLETAYLAALVALLILYPICRVYRMFKWRNPNSVLRFV